MTKHSSFLLSLAGALAVVVALSFLPACASAGTEARAVVGATAWQDNCGRCHNFRSPGDYSDANWDVAALHMRIRANIPAEDIEAIRVFLQAGN